MAARKQRGRNLADEGYFYATYNDMTKVERGTKIVTIENVTYEKIGDNIWVDEDAERATTSDILAESPQIKFG